MDRIEVMKIVRSYQVGGLTRRQFLHRAGAAVGSMAAANMLLTACAQNVNENPPPVVDQSQPPPEIGTADDGDLTTGTITYPGPGDEELMGYLAHQTGGEARPAVIVLQEWWGLNDHIRDLARRFAQQGYVALAPDLYGGVATTEPDEARKLAMALSTDEAVREIGRAAAYLQGMDEVDGNIGIVGFCMGGGLVYQSAAADIPLGAAVGFYGSPLDEARAAQVDVPTMSLLGTADRIPVADLEAMHAVFEANDVPHEFHLYEGAPHAFFNDTRDSSYTPDAAEDAWTRTLSWFQQHLGA